MPLALITPFRKDIKQWKKSILAMDPAMEVYIYPDIPQKTKITAALLWKQPANVFAEFPQLQWVSSLGAGVDHILSDPNLPDHIIVTRIVASQLAEEMTRYLVMGVLNYQKNYLKYAKDQCNKKWEPFPARRDLCIGLLGLGWLGSHVARVLSGLEFEVIGYSTSKKNLDGITSYHGKTQLAAFQAKVDVLINLLPLTPVTYGILSADFFAKLGKSAYLINVARGEHLVEKDLFEALDDGRLSGALLDVFEEEPLPEGHPFWTHPKITITPHVASWTDPATAAQQLVENYHRMCSGKALLNQIDRNKGY